MEEGYIINSAHPAETIVDDLARALLQVTSYRDSENETLADWVNRVATSVAGQNALLIVVARALAYDRAAAEHTFRDAISRGWVR